jgi:FkbM family methyltransferase
LLRDPTTLLDSYGNHLEDLQTGIGRGLHAAAAYSWEGEDILAWKILQDHFRVGNGFYVDIGAHHPSFLSNTFLFYQRGWRGINIDAMPGSMAAFRQIRPEDTNLEIGIAPESSFKVFVRFDDPGLNGFLTEDQISSQTGRGCKVVGTSVVECMPITAILDRYSVRGNFDLLSVDIEGAELDVFGSLDFDRYRPKLIIAEIVGCPDIEAVLADPLAKLMKGKGYLLFSRLHFSVFFIDGSSSRLI